MAFRLVMENPPAKYDGVSATLDLEIKYKTESGKARVLLTYSIEGMTMPYPEQYLILWHKSPTAEGNIKVIQQNESGQYDLTALDGGNHEFGIFAPGPYGASSVAGRYPLIYKKIRLPSGPVTTLWPITAFPVVEEQEVIPTMTLQGLVFDPGIPDSGSYAVPTGDNLESLLASLNANSAEQVPQPISQNSENNKSGSGLGWVLLAVALAAGLKK